MRGAPATKDSEDRQEDTTNPRGLWVRATSAMAQAGTGILAPKALLTHSPPSSGGSGAPPYLVQHQVVLPIPQRGAIRAHQPHKGHGENPLAAVLGWEGHTEVREREWEGTRDTPHGREGGLEHGHSQSLEERWRKVNLRCVLWTSSMGTAIWVGTRAKVRAGGVG